MPAQEKVAEVLICARARVEQRRTCGLGRAQGVILGVERGGWREGESAGVQPAVAWPARRAR